MDTAAFGKTEKFFSAYSRIRYNKGEVILRAEEPPAGAMYLKAGLVRQFALSEKGEMLVLHTYRPGSFFPMTWVVNSTPNRHYFEALTPVEIWRAPKEDVLSFLEKHPEALFHFTSRLLFGVAGLLRRMEQLVLEDSYTKTVNLLDYYVKNFGKTVDGGAAAIDLTHREIAAWIGTTRETASIQVGALQKKGLVTYHKRKLIIPNPLALTRELASN